MVAISLLITLVYSLLILAFIIGFNRVKPFNGNTVKTLNSFSIIIPFRNERENLLELLASLSQIEYPKEKYEIILINDDSTDDSVEITRKFINQNDAVNILILNNKRKSNSPKKDAIETAINQTKHNWIVTTDADCIVPNKWLKTLNTYIEKNKVKMICAPVTYRVKSTVFEQFQLLDFMSLIGATIGGFGIKKPFLNNGANLCYAKKTFIELNGFEGNNNIASGDDVFLLEKIIKHFPNQVHFLKSKDALVITKPQNSLKNLIYQHVRWASKTTSSSNFFGKFVGVSVLSMNLLILVLFLFQNSTFNFFLTIFLLKFILDFYLILKTVRFTEQTKIIYYYPIIALFYPFFTISIAFLAFFKKSFRWKDRKFKS